MGQGAVFFDRDGVLNREIGYAHRPDEIEWVPGVVEAIRAVNAAGKLALVVTNQSGIARGYFQEADVLALHRWMAGVLAEQGARIDGFAYCPHHPEGVVAPFVGDCECRKPKAGMLEALIAGHGVDRTRSVLIGDRDSDLQAAAAAGVTGVLFDGVDLQDTVRRALALAA